MNQIAIYSNYNVSKENIKTLKEFFSIDNVVVFSSAPYNIDDPSIAVISVYHMFFHDGIIVFINESDMQKYVCELKSDEIFMLVNDSIIKIDAKEIRNELRSNVG